MGVWECLEVKNEEDSRKTSWIYVGAPLLQSLLGQSLSVRFRCATPEDKVCPLGYDALATQRAMTSWSSRSFHIFSF